MKSIAYENGRVLCGVHSRIVGYLCPVRNWNVGKKQEFAERKEYAVSADSRSL